MTCMDEMCPVPAGKFTMGSPSNQHTLYLPEYRIARTPVTNAQYHAFVQAIGREAPSHWEGSKPPQDREDHPVTWVTWYDAIAYCRWLTETSGTPYCLPSEAEWEKAARGTDGRMYPWGDEWGADRCKTGQGGTSPVEAYPRGASPYGCLGMTGNVWEWTRSLWGEYWHEPEFKYPYEPDDGRENLDAGDDVCRVLRGACWIGVRYFGRCAYRHFDPPTNAWGYNGFRLCISAGHAEDGLSPTGSKVCGG